jgi:hypothetical protein
MVISHKNKYLFVQLPHTGCSAIARELREYYDGEPIHRKHSRYHHFLKSASEAEKKYFVFSGIRNPIEDAMSMFFKLKSNHEGYDNPINYIENGGFVTKRMRRKFEFVKNNHGDFKKYFRKSYRYPYDNWSRLDHCRFDYIIRFERIQDDFSEVLMQLGIEQIRPLPVYNKTRKRRDDETHLSASDLKNRVHWVFAPFMQKWGYKMPTEIGDGVVPFTSRIAYEIIGILRSLYWRMS